MDNNNDILNQKTKSNKKSFIKVLAIIGGVVLGFIIVFILIFVISSVTSKKLVCQTPYGNITLMYNNKKIIGYTATGDISFKFDEQNKLAVSKGIDNYIIEFEEWINNNANGTCAIK